MSLSGKPARVTGASRGSGAGSATRLLLEGATVVLVTQDTRRKAEVVASALVVAGNLTRPGDRQRMLDETLAHVPMIDLLVSCAGMVQFLPLEQTTEASLERHFQLTGEVDTAEQRAEAVMLLAQVSSLRGTEIRIDSGSTSRYKTVIKIKRGIALSMLHILWYTPGPNWLPNIPVTQQPLEAHLHYMHTLAQRGMLLMGGPLLDDSGGLILLKVPNLLVAQQIMADDPACLTGVVIGHVHPWMPLITVYEHTQ